LLSSPSSPPAFAWEEWYNSIGGRRIKIAEVEEILKQIREAQYPRFTGEVNPHRTVFSNDASASHAIKQKAFELGAGEAGIAAIEPSDIYKGREVKEKYAVVVGQRMLWRNFQEVPSHESAIECLEYIFRLGKWLYSLLIISGVLDMPAPWSIRSATVMCCMYHLR
jgi:hypothetical protein